MVVMMAFSLFTATHVSAQPAGPTITVTQGEGGTITPGTVTITPLTNKKFTITPNAYYHITDVTVDAVSVYANLTWNTTNKKIAYYRFIAVDADHEITATYGLDTRKLTVSKAATGTGTVTDDLAQLDCGDDCVGDYEYDVKGATWPSVALTATADKGSRFQGWFDAAGALLSNASPYTTKMSKNKKITAKFIKTYALTTSTDGEGTGTVTTALVSGKSFGGGVYRLGSVVAVTAKPDFGMNFTGWSGDATGTTKKVNITMNADKSVNATFTVAGASKIASKVSVVDAKSGLTSPKPGMQALRIGRLTGVLWPPPGSDYELDQTNVYVEERSAEAFKTINEILCKIDQAKYAEMLNQGDYKAQIDNNLCSSGKDSASDAGQQSQNQSSGANMPDYELWTLNSSRDNDSSPHIVKAWIHKKGGDYEPDTLIYAKVEITEGASEENPFGLFTINFKASPIHPETGQVLNSFKLFYGFLKTELDPVTGKVLLKFTDKFEIPTVIAEQYGLDAQTSIEKATLDKKADGGTGKGTVYTYDKSPWTPPTGKSETLNFAFDTDYFHRQEVGNPEDMCLDRNNFAETVWSYGLYDSLAGARINRNSGFSVKKTEGDKNYYGWIGYWGVWFPEEVTINNGDTVYKITYGPGGTEDPYTVLKASGKLKKYTLKPLTLLDIKNVPLNYSPGTGGPQGDMYRVKWDGTDFTMFAKFDPTTNVWGPLSGTDPTKIDLNSLGYDMLVFYSQALNGNVQVKLNYENGCTYQGTFSCPATDSTPVNSYTEDLIYPSDTVPAELVCFGNCPDATNLSESDPFIHYDWEPQMNTPPADSEHASYTFDTANMVLMSGATPVIADNPAPNFQWGLMSGPLFGPAYLNNLACDLDGDLVNESTCGWKTWSELPEYYIWETGPNDWNQFTALENPPPPDGDGSIVPFEPPLLVSYTHNWDDATQSTFYLEYSGFGNLQGIPGKCVDKDAGEEMPCGPDTRWIPQFNIPSDTQVTDAADGTIYRVKQLEKEQRMAEAADPASCAELTLKPYTLPDLADWVDPSIGAEPVVEGAPAVIGGVIGGGTK
jgi:hypothetical protein